MYKIITAALLSILGLMILYSQNTPISRMVIAANNIEFTNPVGFASLEGGTTGGEGGNSIIVSAEHNYLINSGQIVENLAGFNFDPQLYYNYTATDSYLVKELVMVNAGAGKLDINTYIGSKTVPLPKVFKLGQNYTNPFNPETSIDYIVQSISPVKLEVYNILGQKVAILVDEIKPVGSYQVTFDGSKMSSGIYLYQLRTSTQVITNKMILLK